VVEVRSEPVLAAASVRLRGRPGRPRKPASAAAGIDASPPGRLLDVRGAAAYLGVSVWTVRDLEAAGELPRVRLPLPKHGAVRRLLFDRQDLDRLIERSKERVDEAVT
jgi:excisionase family DNA binding protein